MPPAICWPAVAPLFNGKTIAAYSLNQSVEGHVTEVPDPAGGPLTVIKMDVLNTDVSPLTPTKDPRAQLLSPKLWTPGTDLWVAGAVYLPASFPTEGITWLGVYEGPYGPPYNGSPPVSLKYTSGPARLQWQRNGTYGFDIPYETPMVKEAWITYLWHIEYEEAGYAELWLNGSPITFFAPGSSYNPNKEPATTKLAMKTKDESNNGGDNEAMIQSYRQLNTLEEVIVYHKPLLIGRTRASVGA